MVTELVGVDHIRPAFGFLTMILGVGVTIGTYTFLFQECLVPTCQLW